MDSLHMYTSSTHMHMLYSILNNSIALLVYEHIRNTDRQEQSKYEMRLEALQSQSACVYNSFNSLWWLPACYCAETSTRISLLTNIKHSRDVLDEPAQTSWSKALCERWPLRDIFWQFSAINPKPLHTLTSDPQEEFLPNMTPLTTYVCASHAIFSAQNGGHKKWPGLCHCKLNRYWFSSLFLLR